MYSKEQLRKNLKDILLKEGVVTPSAMNEALQEQGGGKEPLIDILVRLGKFDSKKLAVILNKHFGYMAVNPAVFVIDQELVDLIPKKIAEKYQALAINRHENTLTVAFANPSNLQAVDEIHAVTRLRIKAAVADAQLLKKYIEKYYGLDRTASSGGKQAPEEEEAKDLDEIVKMIEDDRSQGDSVSSEELMKVALETPVVKLVNMLLMEGIRRKASDIFIEPWERFVRVRTRVDGLLEEIIRPQKSLGPAIVSRIKIMSDLNIAEHRIPQDGRFKVKITGREIDMRVSILPSVFGEKVCLRVLDTKSQSHDIAKLGFDEKEQTIIKDCARKPHGMILVTGPTGSGKTTTLYSVLKYLDHPEVNITTVEDPVEYQLPGINQVNVKESIGLSFPASLRSILRQDPDIVLIGEIRDNETLDIAVKAALTGHLVLSTLHTNDSTSSITRMINMGLEPFLITSTVLMISAQRLVRKLCPKCRQPEHVDESILKRFELDPRKKHPFQKGIGCNQCRHTGYSGRTVITEILPMSREIRQRIMEGATAEGVKEYARHHEMTTLRQCAIRKALEGETTVEEVFRVTSDDHARKKPAAEASETEEQAA